MLKSSARVIAATNRSLFDMVEQKLFRRDLYYRLNVLELYVPSLKERKEDIPYLIEHFIKKYNQKLGRKINGITDDGMESLLKYEWPGNIRELENIIERAINISREDKISRNSLFSIPHNESGIDEENLEIITLAEMELRLIKKALSRFGEDLEGKKKAAKALGISLANLYNKLKIMKKIN